MEALELLSRLLSPGDRVVEVGAHIGYFTILFSRLVGAGGHVTVFESAEKIPVHLLRNTRALGNVTIREEAVGGSVVVANFYLESISGQNNSLIGGTRALSQR